LELFKLFGTIAIDNDNANKEIDETTAKASSANSKMSTAFGSIGQSAVKVGKIVAVGFAAVTAGFAALGTKAVKYNSEMEQYQTSFEVMLGSQKEALLMMDELKSAAATTPFEMTDLANTTQLLLNYGLTAEEATGRMMMLGDIAQGNADKMKRVAMAYGQMSSAGKVQLEDIKQMIEAGFNPLQEISETTGESMDSLYDRISKGTIAVEEITDSMIRSTSEGGRYFQSMEKQSQTFEGRLSTLKDTVNEALGKAFQGVSTILANDVLPTITVMAEKYIPLLGNVIEKLIPPIMEMVGTLLPVAVKFLDTMAPLIQPILDLLLLIIQPLIQLIELILPQLIQGISAIATVMVETTKSIMKSWDEIWSKTTATTEKIFTAVSTRFTALKENISKIFTSVAQTLAKIWDGIQETFRGAINWIIGGVEKWINNIISAINRLLDGLEGIADKFGKKFGIDIDIPYLSKISLPRLEKGGILERGQVGLLEGNGAEAVVPLDQNRAWISAVAEDMNAALGGSKDVQELKELLASLVDELPDMMVEAFAAMRFDVNNREFARLVKAVN
jgi:tape measure domain-containing protein